MAIVEIRISEGYKSGKKCGFKSENGCEEGLDLNSGRCQRMIVGEES